MVYTLTQNISIHTDGTFFMAENGKGYYKNDELHVVQGKYHFIGTTGGWFLVGMKDGRRYAQSGTPTVNLNDIDIIDNEIFEEILTELTTPEPERKHGEKE